MRRNFIDTDALNTSIAEELANLVPLLIPYRQSFENVLRRNLPLMRLGTRTLPRAGDPQWTLHRRAAGEPLFRLGQTGLLEARRLIRGFLFDIEELAALPPAAADGLGQRVARALAGVTHWKVAASGRATLVQAMGQDALLEQVRRHVAHLDDDQPFTTPCVIRAGGLTGRRATTFHAITTIGREARNCLRYSVRNGVRDDDMDIWVIRRGPQLVAVASVFRERMITELRGPGNSSRFRGTGHRLVTWIAASGFRVDGTVEISIADLLGVARNPDPTADDVEAALTARIAQTLDVFDDYL